MMKMKIHLLKILFNHHEKVTMHLNIWIKDHLVKIFQILKEILTKQ